MQQKKRRSGEKGNRPSKTRDINLKRGPCDCHAKESCARPLQRAALVDPGRSRSANCRSKPESSVAMCIGEAGRVCTGSLVGERRLRSVLLGGAGLYKRHRAHEGVVEVLLLLLFEA